MLDKNINLIDYNLLRVATCSPELKVADPEFNTNEIINIINDDELINCNIILFPELSITSYTCGDLFLDNNLLKSAIDNLGRIVESSEVLDSLIIVGCPINIDSILYNCGVVIQKGEILGIVPKSYICNYGEFYEARWFKSGVDTKDIYINILEQEVPFGVDILFGSGEVKFGIEICEDLWAFKPPSIEQTIAGANLIFNLSASNELLSKQEYRKQLISSHSAKLICAYVYASSGIGESSTDLVFSGHSLIAQNGKILSETERFQFDSQYVISDIDFDIINAERLKFKTYSNETKVEFREVGFEINDIHTNELILSISKTPFIPNEDIRKESCEEILNIQASGLAKRLKHISAKSALIGLSGGLDSTLALLVTIKAFKKLNKDLKDIYAIVMPAEASSERTQSNAEKLANLLGVTCKVINISDAVDLHLDLLEHNKQDYDITYENAQARKRTQILMDLSNKFKGIVIGTGDLSELALGWCTYNGDQMSMYGVNSGVPKTLIKYLINNFVDEFENEEIKRILLDIIDTPISPELIPQVDKIQSTEDKVGEYILQDFFLYFYLKYKFSPKKLFLFSIFVFSKNYEKKYILNCLKIFFNRFFDNQFKRSAMPDGPKVGSINLSPRGDWRMPSDASKKLWIDELSKIEKEIE